MQSNVVEKLAKFIEVLSEKGLPLLFETFLQIRVYQQTKKRKQMKS